MHQIKQHANENICKILVGTKNDLERNVEYKEAEQLAQMHGMKFFETSSKTGNNIEASICELARDVKNILKKEEEKSLENQTKINLDRLLANKKQKTSCCSKE